MSIEQSLESIAKSLEKLANPMNTVETTPPPPPVVTGGPDLLPTSPGGRKGGKKKAEPASTVAPTATPMATPTAIKPEVSKADITSTLQAFLKKFSGPEGAEKARVFFTNAGAKNITTLDPLKYKEVFLGLQQAMK